MKMVEVKTAELIGRALDYAVAVVEGHPLCEECCSGTYALIIGTGRGDLKEFSPSTDWSHGGPLIEAKSLEITKIWGPWAAIREAYCGEAISWWPDGETILIAACRAIVAAKLGETVMVPKELMP